MPTFFPQILVQPSICSLAYSEPLPIPLTAPNYSTLVEESALVNIFAYSDGYADSIISLQPLWAAIYVYDLMDWPARPWTSSVLVASIVSRCLAGAVDIVILWLTWKKTYRSWARASTLGVRTPVTALLLRDGLSFYLHVHLCTPVDVRYSNIGTAYFL